MTARNEQGATPCPQDEPGGEEIDAYCDRCGGDGAIMAWEGDGSDWGEDTYSGPMDEVITCRACGGTGMRR